MSAIWLERIVLLVVMSAVRQLPVSTTVISLSFVTVFGFQHQHAVGLDIDDRCGDLGRSACRAVVVAAALPLVFPPVQVHLRDRIPGRRLQASLVQLREIDEVLELPR